MSRTQFQDEKRLNEARKEDYGQFFQPLSKHFKIPCIRIHNFSINFAPAFHAKLIDSNCSL